MTELRLAAKYNPFDQMMRGASARLIGNLAVAGGDAEILNVARHELGYALRVDFSSADLMLKLILVDLKLGTVESRKEAADVFQVYKATAPGSPIWRQLEPLFKQ